MNDGGSGDLSASDEGGTKRLSSSSYITLLTSIPSLDAMMQVDAGVVRPNTNAAVEARPGIDSKADERIPPFSSNQSLFYLDAVETEKTRACRRRRLDVVNRRPKKLDGKQHNSTIAKMMTTRTMKPKRS